MDSLLMGVQNIRLRQKVRDDDTVDQLHHFVTVYLLAVYAVIVGIKEYVGQPLDCWVTVEKWGHFQQHVNSYCWSHLLYRFPDPGNKSVMPFVFITEMAQPITTTTTTTSTATNFAGIVSDIQTNTSTSTDDQTEFQINFYRWITIIFLVQAVMFKIPSMLWQECNNHSGTQMEKMVTIISDSTFDVKDKRSSAINVVAEYLETWLRINRKPFSFMRTRIGQQTKKILRKCMVCIGGNTSNFLSTSYLIVKLCFLFNVIFQFIVLTAFLKFNFWHFGPYAISRYNEEGGNEYFPRVGLCPFNMKGEKAWIQCMLTLNMLLEKMLLVEWFWLFFLLVLTIINLAGWLWKTLKTDASVKFIRKFLCIMEDGSTLQLDGNKNLETFVVNYLGNDGVFVLRILSTNTNKFIMTQLIYSLWQRFLAYENKAQEMPSEKRHTLKGEDVIEMDPLDAKMV